MKHTTDSVKPRASARKRLMAVGGLFLGLLGAAAFGTAPAMAWSSSFSTQSPPGCSGGFVGSSYKPTSTTGYASVSNYGSTCSGTRPTGGAAIRYNNGTFIAVCITTSSVHNCSSTMSVSNNAVGGYHDWGNRSFSS